MKRLQGGGGFEQLLVLGGEYKPEVLGIHDGIHAFPDPYSIVKFKAKMLLL